MFSNANQTRAPKPSYNVPQQGGPSLFTEVESLDKKLPFDYVATAASFVISNTHRPEALTAVYQQHAPECFRNHSLAGSRITHVQCNELQNELLTLLRSKLPVTRVMPVHGRAHAA